MKSKLAIRAGAVVAIIVVAVCLFLVLSLEKDTGRRIDPGTNTLGLIHYAVVSYRKQFEEYPSGNDAEVGALLAGENRAGTKFLDERSLDEKKIVVDFWRTPVRFVFFEDGRFCVKSAGPDKTWRTKDDMEYGFPLQWHNETFPSHPLTTESQYR